MSAAFQDENPQIVQANRSATNSIESIPSGSTPDYASDTAYETSEIGTSSLGRDNVSEAGTEDLSLDEDLTGPLEKLVKHGMSNIDEGLLMGNAILEQVEGYSRHHTIHSREINVNRVGDRNGDHVSEKRHDKLTGSNKTVLNGTNSLPNMEFSSLLADDGLATSSDVSLVLPLGQQQKLNRVLINMQRRLGTAKTDMEDVISRLNQEIAVKDYLISKVLLELMSIFKCFLLKWADGFFYFSKIVITSTLEYSRAGNAPSRSLMSLNVELKLKPTFELLI